MVREATVPNSGDWFSGLNGPSFFLRTIRTPANVPVPSDLKDLDSVHSLMKSLNVLRSPQKLMNEAKKIVDGGAELPEPGLVGFTENVGITNAIAAKGKDKPQDRRPALGLGRKRAPFSLKAKFSQPSENLAPTFDIDQLEDPDEFFDVYERNENAKKEIQKQLGGNVDNINLYEPSKKERVRRPSILGKTYKYNHRFSSTPGKIDEMWMSSQETVSQDIPSLHKDSSQEKFVHPDPNPDVDLEEVEPEEVELEEAEPESTKKAGSDVNNILDELLSCNMEDLEGHGALNLLQERLNIMPLDIANLRMTEHPDVGRTGILAASESLKKLHNSSVDIDSVLKNLSRKLHSEQEAGADPINHVSSPTPPRSPLESISLLKKRILQPNPMMDSFSPLNIDLSSRPNASPSPSQQKDKIIGEVDAHHDINMSSELETQIEFSNPEPPVSNMNAQEVMGNDDSCAEQFVDETASIQRENLNSRPNASPSELEPHVGVGYIEPAVSNMDVQMGDADSLPEQPVDENANIRRNADIMSNEESDNDIGKPMDVHDAHESNPHVFEEGVRVDTSSRRQMDTEQPLEVSKAKPHKRKTVAGKKRIRNPPVFEEEARVDTSDRKQMDIEQPLEVSKAKPHERKTVAGKKRIRNPPVFEEEARVDTSDRQQMDIEQPLEVPTAKPQRKKTVVGEKCIRNAHPMRKSLAEAGTTFENGLRRSRRIRSRPLEFWKGERFVFGRVNNSVKLIGVKSLGEGSEELKVRPYISLEASANKEILELAARH